MDPHASRLVGPVTNRLIMLFVIVLLNCLYIRYVTVSIVIEASVKVEYLYFLNHKI